MKKDEFKKSIDNINPDAYMGSRLKAKITTAGVPVKSRKSLALTITAFCLAFAIVFGAGFLFPTQKPSSMQYTSENAVSNNRTITAFITVASASNTESTEAAIKSNTLELNVECPYAIFLRAQNTAELSDKENQEFTLDLDDFLKKHGIDGDILDTSMLVDSIYKDITLTQYTVNEFKLNLEDVENVKSINVKNTSKYGEMVYDENKPVFDAPVHGNDITINGEDFDFEEDGFYWDHTIEMEEAFYENINIPFSTFNDTITFTVEYTDGSKAIGVVELAFDDDGNATVVCKNYDCIA